MYLMHVIKTRYTLEFRVGVMQLHHNGRQSRSEEQNKKRYNTDCGLIVAISFSSLSSFFGGKYSGHAPEVCLAAACPYVVS